MKYVSGVIIRVLFDSNELTHATMTVLPEVGKHGFSRFCLMGFPMLMFEASRHGCGVSHDNETCAFVFSNQMEYFKGTNCDEFCVLKNKRPPAGGLPTMRLQ